jgi:hypothetical protein
MEETRTELNRTECKTAGQNRTEYNRRLRTKEKTKNQNRRKVKKIKKNKRENNISCV